jgi:RNA polymerase-interacting CarD/CdnL/TRCF family regulator
MSIHYETDQGFDVIDIAKAYDLNFNRGNVVKYLCRAGKKDSEIRDLEKALDYLQKEIKYLRQIQSNWIEQNK